MTTNRNTRSSSNSPIPEWLRSLRVLVGDPFVDEPEHVHAHLQEIAARAKRYPSTLDVVVRPGGVLQHPEDYDVEVPAPTKPVVDED